MTTKIDQPIVSSKVITEEEQTTNVENIVNLNENVKRDDILEGRTYKIKPPSDCAIYITINDIVLNEGTDYQERRPYEIFINSKNMEHYQWIVALTRVISAVFRKGGNITFLTDELKMIFDPKGGYYKKGQFINSIVAEIGMTIEKHILSINNNKIEE